MAQELINVGINQNDGTGDTLRSGAIKINSNFTELYSKIPSLASSSTLGVVKVDGTSITINNQGAISATPFNLPVATSFNLGGVKQGANVSISTEGVISVANPYVLPTATTTTLGGVKVDGQSITINDGIISANFESTRVTFSITSSNLSAGSSESLTIPNAFRSYMLLRVVINQPAWVVLYTSQAARSADSTRTILNDPNPGSGVLAEFVTLGSETITVSPAVLGFNDEPVTVPEIYLKVTNKDVVSRTITVNLTLIKLEI